MNTNTLHLDILTPSREAFSEDVEAVYAPTKNGIIGILPHHTALFTALSEGEIKIVIKGKDLYLAIGGGFMEVSKNVVNILVSQAVHADELNEVEILKAQKEAKDVLKRKDATLELSEIQSILRRSVLELKVIRHHKNKRQRATN